MGLSEKAKKGISGFGVSGYQEKKNKDKKMDNRVIPSAKASGDSRGPNFIQARGAGAAGGAARVKKAVMMK